MVAALIIAPQFAGNYLIYVLSLWAIITISAQGLNLTMGFAGKVSLAQGAFMGIGAYTSVLLVKNGWANYWIAMLIAAVFCMMIGALIGFPALRVKGHYLAFVTLAFNELVILVLRNEEQWTGGPLGILNIERPCMVGGRGTMAGPFIGAFFAKVLPELLRFANEYYLIVFAVFVMVVILFFPTGIVGIGSYLKDRFFSGKEKESG